MTMDVAIKAIKNVREMERSLRVSVKIPHDEVDRIVVERLIAIRNSDSNRNRDMAHFDKVLRFFLSDEEFQKYVVREVPICPL